MELIKIGRDPRCDISINLPFISNLHAEILIDDQGNMTIEDKNSANGTLLNGQPLPPNQPTPVMRGDKVEFAVSNKNAGVPLQWDRVPTGIKPGLYKEIINIGSSQTNEIIPQGDNTVSRYHAELLIGKDGKVYIRDNGSRNGTLVDGMKINPRTPVRLKSGSQVTVGKTDITEDIKPYIKSKVPGWLRIGGISVGIAAALCGIVLGIIALIGRDTHPTPDELASGVVWVKAKYHYKVVFDEGKLPISREAWSRVTDDPYGTLTLPVEIPYSGTAFFIDENGRLATNRHVAEPWVVTFDKSNQAALQEIWSKIQLRTPTLIFTQSDLDDLKDTQIGQLVIAEASYRNELTPSTLTTLATHMVKLTPEITGEMDYITVGYPGRHYSSLEEFDRCFVASTSGQDDEDVAILQLNTKHTPDNVKYIYKPETFFTGKLEPLKDDLIFIGYPSLSEIIDESLHSLNPEMRAIKCSREPAAKNFFFQGASGHGASGSPIYDRKNGLLVGVLWGGYENSDYGMAAQAKVLKKLYDKVIEEQ